MSEPLDSSAPVGGEQTAKLTSKRSFPRRTTVGSDEPAFRQPVCPAYIVDTAPGGGGLGVWVLAEQTDSTCDYVYVGSPS
ncbi:hypothetical protein GGD56_002442 [Rhizobium mongolense]|uniref:Uncharacterized protein n=2 Tax=Rhizobium mongolense TaxID=57676 RepID=A0ABR6IL34_9HYPH|nr:hypothetical protein [Rhizobium mongolense]TVZ63800.1 hypothetical protein BCL32_3974 [Rhizobium mongolense USDA 1844]